MTNDNNIYKQYFTPKKIAELLVSYIPINNIRNVIDLAVGDGELLRAVANKFCNAVLFGADIDSKVVNKLREDSKVSNMKLWVGDSLGEDINYWSDYYDIVNNNKFCLTIGNPPFDYFSKSKLNDNYDKKYPIEVKFLLKYIEITRVNGYIAIILPNGILTNSNSKAIRQLILQKTYIECIIQLYRNSFSKVSADISLLILRKKARNILQERITIKKVDQNLNEKDISIESIDGIERLDFDYYVSKQEIDAMLDKLPFELVKLKDIVETCRRGKTLTDKQECISTNGIPFIHTTNVNNIFINQDKFQYIDYAYENLFCNAKVYLGDVLIARVGSNCIKKIGIVSNKLQEGIASDCLFILRNFKISPYFLALYLRSELGYKQLEYAKRGSCSKFITKKDILNIYVPIIPKQLEREIEKRIRYILSKNLLNCNYDKLDQKINNEINKLEIMLGCKNDDSSIEICASTN